MIDQCLYSADHFGRLGLCDTTLRFPGFCYALIRPDQTHDECLRQATSLPNAIMHYQLEATAQ